MAITRAKQRLWITYANSRYRFGSLVQNEPSRFVGEIPEQYVDNTFTGGANRATGSVNAFGSMMNQSFEKVPSLKKLADKIQQKPAATHQPTGNFSADDPLQMEVGMEVEHQKFGFGKITGLEGGMANRIAAIDFGGSHGTKKIMLNYAKLRIVR